MELIVFPGDGIGPEVTDATLAVMSAANQRFDLGLKFDVEEVGNVRLAQDGSTFPDPLYDKARAADGIILGPVDTADYPPPDQGGVNVSSTTRKFLDLYANLRPSRTRKGTPALVADMDLLVVRENTEGFYADRNMAMGSGEFAPTEDVALAVRKITAEGSRRIAHTAFQQAQRRRRQVTVVTKVNVLKVSDGLFLRHVRDVAREYPDVALEHVLVDAMASLLVREPGRFDVIVSTNMFGDILSNEAAELAGGLGLAASLNAGDGHAMAQASHGSAPEIAGRDIANPAALIESSAMLLDWLAGRHDRADLAEAANCITDTVSAMLAAPESRTADLGGRLGTSAFGTEAAARIAAGS